MEYFHLVTCAKPDNLCTNCENFIGIKRWNFKKTSHICVPTWPIFADPVTLLWELALLKEGKEGGGRGVLEHLLHWHKQ